MRNLGEPEATSPMNLWYHWWVIVSQLRPACSRQRSFLWLVVTLAAMGVRGDMGGVTSFVRALGLKSACYGCLLDFFHSRAVGVDALARTWVRVVLKVHPGVQRVNGRLVLLADGLKKSKAGRKMPAVKALHQASDSNTKPEYIMGHSCQALAMLAKVGKCYQAIPLTARIHEGLVFSNRDRRTLLDKLLLLLAALQLPEKVLLVADAYYACGKVIGGLLDQDSHLISRLKKNACAYMVPTRPSRPGRGRPKIYGQKILLRELFDRPLQSMPSPAYGEENVTVQYLCCDLLWRPAGRLVRFVAVVHPQRGKILLLCTDLTLAPAEIIRLYALRFKIEVCFKQALHTVGAWAYHFWMRPMTPLRRFQGDQFLHRKSKAYRDALCRKLEVYHRHIQIGLIAQGLLQCLAATQPALVWRHFGSWLRTVRSPLCPSEFVVACSLRHSLPEFLSASPMDSSFELFLRQRLDLERIEGTCLAA
jgi:hypothetical protein